MCRVGVSIFFACIAHAHARELAATTRVGDTGDSVADPLDKLLERVCCGRHLQRATALLKKEEGWPSPSDIADLDGTALGKPGSLAVRGTGGITGSLRTRPGISSRAVTPFQLKGVAPQGHCATFCAAYDGFTYPGRCSS